MSLSYRFGLAFGEWLKANALWSEGGHRHALVGLRALLDYCWLVAGLLLIWVGLISVYIIYSTGMPSLPSVGILIGPVCLYRFAKLRMRRET
jgi:hypothetical protein